MREGISTKAHKITLVWAIICTDWKAGKTRIVSKILLIQPVILPARLLQRL